MNTLRRARRHCQPVCSALIAVLALTYPAVAADDTHKSTGEVHSQQTHLNEPPVTEIDRRHWSFFPLQPQSPPKTQHDAWVRNSIDSFVAARLEQEGLTPQPEASRETLIRRLSFDLTGLPPTPEEIDEFLGDESAFAYDTLVSRLLNQPGYGERWAQHWLDLARFAETDGFEHDHLRPDAWQYRDWVIEALNADMPYDEFLRQQLAGDELYPGDDAVAVATRFCLSGPDMPDINSQEERRHTLLNELTSTVSSVVLGLQMGCAQCHDHKYDPISQADFYRLRAIFEPAVQVRKSETISGLRDRPPFDSPGRMMLRGDFRRAGPELQPAVPRIAAAPDFEFQPVSLRSTSGRRTALADWVTSRENPLPARVIVNRVWQHHFGTGLSDTPSDFGVMGSEPTHPELLDWLAAWLMDHDWRLKDLHRLIVSSATWRQRSRLPENSSAIEQQQWQQSLSGDPDAPLLSRYPRWRLEGEAVRDAMLRAAGVLNRKAGGPGVRPPLPEELLGTLLKNQWTITEDAQEHDRRSIYVFARRNLRYPIFEVFDRPDANASCPRRSTSTTAPQSLYLLNSRFSFNIARRFAESVAGRTTDPAEQVTQVFRRALGRVPTADEMAQARGLLADQHADEHAGAAASGKPPADALLHLCLVVVNLNEFIHPD